MSRTRSLTALARKAIGRIAHDAGAATRADIQRVDTELAGTRAELATTRAELSSMGTRLHAVSELLDAVRATLATDGPRLAEVERLISIDAVTRWIRQATLQSHPLVSVVLPTCNRPALLQRAVRSVIDQRYENWELLVVDDGDEQEPRAFVEAVGDPRISLIRAGRRGVSAARNLALQAARGDLVTYLDDDNVMDPEWLYAVVWAFEQRPEADVLYGAFAVDDVKRLRREQPGSLPRVFLHPFSREALRTGNLADLGAIAHRAGLPEARFDETLAQLTDWDLLLRLTADRDPLVLPAVACYYTTDAPNRLTSGPAAQTDLAKVLARAIAGP